MSMNNYAGLADTIEESFLQHICPKEFINLLNVLKDNNSDLEGLGMCSLNMEEDLNTDFGEEVANEIISAYDSLCTKFKEETNLELNIGYHEAEDRADEVNGVYWFLDGVYQYSPAGEKYKDKIERKCWTTFG